MASEQKLLPAVPSSDSEENATTMQVGTTTVLLDKLGPMVVNSNGTLSRIGNWQEMTEAERDRTVRVLVKRNQLAGRKEVEREMEKPE